MLEMAPEVVDKGFLLSSLRHFIDGLELDFARYAAEFDQSKQWDEEGFNNPADWMRFNCHMNSQGKFYYKVLHYKHSVDAGAYNRAQEELAEERSLRLSTAEDGCLLISGVLDPIGGAAVRTALEPLAQPSGA